MAVDMFQIHPRRPLSTLVNACLMLWVDTRNVRRRILSRQSTLLVRKVGKEPQLRGDLSDIQSLGWLGVWGFRGFRV